MEHGLNTGMKVELEKREVMEKIIEAAFEVYKELGYGFSNAFIKGPCRWTFNGRVFRLRWSGGFR